MVWPCVMCLYLLCRLTIDARHITPKVHAELKNDRSYQQLQKIVRMRLMEAGAIVGSIPTNSRNLVQASSGFQLSGAQLASGGTSLDNSSEAQFDTLGHHPGVSSWQPTNYADPSFYFNPLNNQEQGLSVMGGMMGDPGARRRALSDNGGPVGGGGVAYRPFLLSTSQGLVAADQEQSMGAGERSRPPQLEDQASLAAAIAAEQL